MSRKRSLEMMAQNNDEVNNNAKLKRIMTSGYEIQTSVEFRLPTQQQELGRFWIDSCQPLTAANPSDHHQQACGPTCNPTGWEDRQLSISLAQHSPGAFAQADEAAMQDTATSSGSESSGEAQQRTPVCGHQQVSRAAEAAAAAAEASEEDSISSHQAPPAAPSPVLYTSATPRSEVDADLSSLYCWEDLQSLLAEVR